MINLSFVRMSDRTQRRAVRLQDKMAGHANPGSFGLVLLLEPVQRGKASGAANDRRIPHSDQRIESWGHHGRSRWQPVVCRNGGEQDRQDHHCRVDHRIFDSNRGLGANGDLHKDRMGIYGLSRPRLLISAGSPPAGQLPNTPIQISTRLRGSHWARTAMCGSAMRAESVRSLPSAPSLYTL